MRESCISHRAREPFIIIRQDYQKLVGGDLCGAALLALIEYWANGEIALNPSVGDRVPLGEVSGEEWQKGLLDIYCCKRILERVKEFIARGFLEVVEGFDRTRRTARIYFARIDKIQDALNRYIFSTPNGQKSQAERTNVPDPNGLLSSSPYIESNKKEKERTPYSPPLGDTERQTSKNVAVLEKDPTIDDLWTTPETNPNPLVKEAFTHEDESAPQMSRNHDKLSIEDCEPLRLAYNAHKPFLWAECKNIGETRLKALRKLFRANGEETMRVLVDALTFCSNDSWWNSKALTIDNLLREGRINEFAERQSAEHKIKVVEAETGVPLATLQLRHQMRGFLEDDSF